MSSENKGPSVRELVKIGNAISKKSSHMMRYLANLILSTQKDDSFKLYLSGNTGLREILDKNDIIDIVYDKFGIVETIGATKEQSIEDNYVQIKLENLISNIPGNICFKLYALLATISEIMILAENEFNIDLSSYKVDIDDWDNIDDIFSPDKFKVLRDREDNFYLCLDYKSLYLKIFRLSKESIYTQKYMNNYVFNDHVIPVMNYTYYKKLKLKNEDNILYDTLSIEKYKNTDGVTRPIYYEGNFIDIDNTKIATQIHKIELGNNVVSISKINLHYRKLLNNLNKDYTDAIACYSSSAFYELTDYLLKNIFFGTPFNLNDTSRYYKNNRKFPCCHKINSHHDFIEKIQYCMRYIKDRSTNIDLDLKNYTLSLIKYTNTSIYDKQYVEDMKKGSIINMPNFVSTSYKISEVSTDFMSKHDSSVIYMFYVSFYKNIGRLLFIDSKTLYPLQKEVVIDKGQTYKIIDKKYETYRSNNGHCVQKLVIYMVFSDDKDAEIYYNRNILKNTNYVYAEDEKKGGNDNYFIIPPNIYDYNKKDLQFISVEQGNIEDIDSFNNSAIPQVGEIYKKAIPITEMDVSIDFFSILNSRGGGSTLCNIYTYKLVSNLLPNFYNIFIYYLSDKAGPNTIELKNKINGKGFIDKSIYYILERNNKPALKGFKKDIEDNISYLLKEEKQNIEFLNLEAYESYLNKFTSAITGLAGYLFYKPVTSSNSTIDNKLGGTTINWNIILIIVFILLLCLYIYLDRLKNKPCNDESALVYSTSYYPEYQIY
jgi:hypothetical protein